MFNTNQVVQDLTIGVTLISQLLIKYLSTYYSETKSSNFRQQNCFYCETQSSLKKHILNFKILFIYSFCAQPIRRKMRGHSIRHSVVPATLDSGYLVCATPPTVFHESF